MYGKNPTDVSVEEIEFYKEQIRNIRKGVKARNINNKYNIEEKEFLLQALKNVEVTADILKYYHIIGGYEGENTYVNIRDKQMAENLMWHKKRNPDAKILVWIANFHGAKNIEKIRYKEDDPNLYNSFTLFNDYLVEEYGDSVYSMAFISSRGKVGNKGGKIPPINVQAPKNSLEYEIENKNIEFGYIDFLSIKEEYPSLTNKRFNSTILGYDNKPGEWLNVFDGVFYIQKNEPVEY